MLFGLSNFFMSAALPTHLKVFCVILGAALGYSRRYFWGRWVISLTILLLLLIAFLTTGQLLAVPLETRFPPPPPEFTPPDGIIVLGGYAGENASDLHGHVTFDYVAERLTAPIELKRRFPKARLVFTGGTRRFVFTGAAGTSRGSYYPESESEMVRSFWQGVGLDEGDVLYEGKSRNTYENAVFTRDLVKPKAGERWLLVTSAIHMPRAVGVFRRAGFSIIAYPVDYRTNVKISTRYVPGKPSKGFELAKAAAHEWVGLLVYRLTGKSSALLPAP